MSTQQEIPVQVCAEFFADRAVKAERLGGGMINATYRVESAQGDLLILQRLSGIFEAESLTEDFARVTDYLLANGWEVPVLVPAANGKLHVMDSEGHPWRAMTWVASDSNTVKARHDAEAMHGYGSLLGAWHEAMKKLDYQPRHVLAHFHDTAFYVEKLRTLLADMPGAEASELAQNFLKAYAALPALPDYGNQLLHGDPRTDNMLFRQGKPFTFIDFDTVMFGSIWLDVGDMLRSLSEDACMAGEAVPLDLIEEAIEGYRQQAHPEADVAQFKQGGFVAMQLIACELGMRFMIDVVEDSYFDWDRTAYDSRAAHNTERAKIQWKILDAARSKIEELS
jgi:Ser/Thr protein kinase RdoA (MazF antagonist)